MAGPSRALVVILAGVALLGGLSQAGSAAQGDLQLALVGTFAAPIYVTAPPGDGTRLFVVEKAGRIRLIRNGGAPTLFLDIAARVDSDDFERGLLSMAFAPDYATSGRFYVYYTSEEILGPPAIANGTLMIVEFRRSAADPDVADPASARTVLAIPHPTYTNHNGGQLQFGPDGYLYIATGDGGGGNDPDDNAQDLDVLLGKLLRIDPGIGPGGEPYTVPATNPFVGQAGKRPEIWAYGLRNPWRFSFDRQTGDLIIADVGQAQWEEVDFAPAASGRGPGANYGWDCFEGDHPYGSDPPWCNPRPANHTPPVHEYSHSRGCSITGGYVVRDPTVPQLVGRYVYADFCQTPIWSAVLQTPKVTDDADSGLDVGSVYSFGEDACGRVYIASGNGPVYRLQVEGGPSTAVCTPFPSPIRVADFNGDGDTDFSVWRPETGVWYAHGGLTEQWGVSADVPVPGQYDRDGATDVAVWRPSPGVWYVHGGQTQQWGAHEDVPVPGDYDGDGGTEFAVWRPQGGIWYVHGGATQQWGISADVPVPGDYDGDGDTDIAVWRPSTGVWYVHGAATQQWGAAEDVPVPGQYDADPAVDIAVWRPSSGTWYVHGGAIQQWGVHTDVPVPGDYDGDGDTEFAVWRPESGVWYVFAGATQQWGVSSDKPLPPLPSVARQLYSDTSTAARTRRSSDLSRARSQ